MQPAHLDLTARKNVDLSIPFTIREAVTRIPLNLAGWVFTMQVRREPDEPGEPLIEVTNSSSTAGDGIEVVEASGYVNAQVSWDTLNDPAIPAGRLAYDLVADLPSGERWGLLEGVLIAKHGVTV